MKKYIAYLRVSTKRQAESGLGLDSQKSIIRHFCSGEDEEIVNEYVECYSGSSAINRPLLQQAIKECNQHGYTLVVAKVDRLSRSVEDIFQIQRILGNKLKSCDLPSMDSLTLSIFAGLAQRELEIIRIRTKAALAEKKKRGVVLGNAKGKLPFKPSMGNDAYKENTDRFKNNPVLMAMLKQGQRDNKPLEEIASDLNENGFKTFRGGQFNKFTVCRLLKKIA